MKVAAADMDVYGSSASRDPKTDITVLLRVALNESSLRQALRG